jgi:pimeloyl-ACP methyl ester carboxylesterase
MTKLSDTCARWRVQFVDRLRGNDFLVFLVIFVFFVVIMLGVISSARAAETPLTLSAAYFPILPFDAPQEAEPSMIPVAGNQPLEGDHPGIKRAIVVIHDFSRDANKALTAVSSLAGSQNSSTMILAPQFLLDSDIARFADALPEKGHDFARWPLGGWSSGGDSLPVPGQKGISSFTVLDLLLMFLADKESFQDLKEITVVGHGEGGDFIQRYAATGQAPDLVGQDNVPVHFIVADAASYLYLTSVRPRENRQGFSPPDTAACKNYNEWPYGLDNLNAYARRAGGNAIKTRFAARQVAYLVGQDVTKSDPAPDSGCAAMFQGPDRVTRAVNFATYAHVLYGEAATQLQNLTVEPAVGYDPAALYGSKCGMTLLFGNGDCTAPLQRQTENQPLQ